MARHEIPDPDLHPAAGLDALIRPGLRRAYPLPEAGGPDEDRFQVLLDALARRSGGKERAGVSRPRLW
ncbi:hypothetical protein [Rubellimicrobium aerolatum]|uniref:Uncharacterized protein n=1 Tax=Rubellimicrobium aerolatum TaxID=490979 RepID=A0ABW0SAF8_9RHOB|nr:hypothetical protein [Rubellimicrobium aerolatum]MBP1805210.1 hypothetical protein [Rubellimicrobium aerolatum]